MKIVAVIPIKLNNERVPVKNIKCFSDGTPLICCIQSTLMKSKLIDEIYVYCSNVLAHATAPFLKAASIDKGYRSNYERRI